MHELLYIEEMAQFEQISQFNVKTKLSIISKYLLMPTSTNSSTAKYARPGELFGKLTLSGSLSEDTTAGRLILTNCTSLLIMEAGQSVHKDRKAYIAGIEDTGKATLYLRLSPNLVKGNFFSKVKLSLVISTTFEYSRQKVDQNFLKMARFKAFQI